MKGNSEWKANWTDGINGWKAKMTGRHMYVTGRQMIWKGNGGWKAKVAAWKTKVKEGQGGCRQWHCWKAKVNRGHAWMAMEAEGLRCLR
jgi:hypothetical protein